jgi:hypothetical protein
MSSGIQNVSPEPPQVIRATEAVGMPGIDIFDGIVRVEPELQLTGQTGVSQFDLMRREDATVASALAALTLPIRRASYEWRSEGSDEHVALIESAFNDMDGSFDDLISEIATMFAFGWSYFAWQLKKRAGPKSFNEGGSKFNDGRMGFRQIALRAQSSLRRWQVAEDGTIGGMWQQTASMNNEQFLPISQGLLFRTSKEANNPEGFSLLRPCWRAWRYKREIERIEAIGLQRALMGTPVVTLQPGASNFATNAGNSDEYRARQVIADLHGNRTLGVVEDSFLKFRFETPKMQGLTGDSSNVLKRKDEDLARALLAMFIMLGSQEQGSWALSRELADMFFLSIEGYLGLILDVLNRDAVPILMRWNGLPEDENMPYLHASINRRIDLETVSKVASELAGAGILTPDNETELYIRKLMGLPETVPEIRSEIKVNPKKDDDEEKNPIGSPPSMSKNSEIEEFAVTRDARGRRYFALEERYSQMLDSAVLEWSKVAAQDLKEIPIEELSAVQVMLVWGLSVEDMESVKEVGWEYLPRAVEMGYRTAAMPVELRGKVEEEIESNDSWINNRLKPLTVQRMDPETAALIVALLLEMKYDEMEEVIGGLTSVVRRHAGLYAGQLWHAIMTGASARAKETGLEPVRWRMDQLAKHCSECMLYAQEYESMEHLLAMTGGTLPGMGTECNGGCRCHLEHQGPSGWTWI